MNSQPAPAALQPAQLRKLEALRALTREVVGPVGEAAVTRHLNKAKAEIEAGRGDSGLQEAAEQIVRATELIKGPQGRKVMDERLKQLLASS